MADKMTSSCVFKSSFTEGKSIPEKPVDDSRAIDDNDSEDSGHEDLASINKRPLTDISLLSVHQNYYHQKKEDFRTPKVRNVFHLSAVSAVVRLN